MRRRLLWMLVLAVCAAIEALARIGREKAQQELKRAPESEEA